MTPRLVTRRGFLRLAGIAALSASPWVKTPAKPAVTFPPGSRFIFRLSVRGRRGSQAAKKHNANHRFATWEAADAHRAHLRDRSRIVAYPTSEQEYQRLFGTGRKAVDLRQKQAAVRSDWNQYI